MTSRPDAPVQRRRLRAELRHARKVAGFTQKDVAEALEWSMSKLIRIEAGAVGVSTTDVRALLQHYRVKDPEVVDRILGLARASKEQRGWWTTYRDLASQQFLTYLGYESSASVLLTFQPLLIPGLLQDERYARAIYRSLLEFATDKQVEELVRLRMRRQQELEERQDPPEMVFVIDEAALHRWVGGPDVMRHQLRRLKDEVLRDNVTIEVVPFTAGSHPGLFGPFTILELADDRDEDILWLENPRGEGGHIFRDEQMEVAPYRETFAQLRDLAHRTDLEAVIDRAMSEMS